MVSVHGALCRSRRTPLSTVGLAESYLTCVLESVGVEPCCTYRKSLSDRLVEYGKTTSFTRLVPLQWSDSGDEPMTSIT